MQEAIRGRLSPQQTLHGSPLHTTPTAGCALQKTHTTVTSCQSVSSAHPLSCPLMRGQRHGQRWRSLKEVMLGPNAGRATPSHHFPSMHHGLCPYFSQGTTTSLCCGCSVTLIWLPSPFLRTKRRQPQAVGMLSGGDLMLQPRLQFSGISMIGHNILAKDIGTGTQVPLDWLRISSTQRL